MATILTKKKDTTGAPSAGDLTNSTGGAELAVNTADKRLYTKDSGGNVVEIGINPTSVTTGALTASSPSVISVDSTSDALRITQVGTGNALVVEDDTNPDSTPVVINASGKVAIGDTSSVFGGDLEIYQNSSSSFSVFERYSANASGYILALVKTRGSTPSAKDIVSSGDNLGIISFQGADGTKGVIAAQIVGSVDGTPGTNDMPGRLVFSTTADGASSVTERMRITSDGYVRLSSNALGIQFGGDTSADNALNDYEIGEWTPEIADASTGGNTGSIGSLAGAVYVKVGQLVNVQAYLTNIDTTGMTGANQFYIRNLPFTARSVTGSVQMGHSPVFASQATYSGYLLTIVNDFTSYCRIQEFATSANPVALIVSDFTSGTSDIAINLTYQTTA